MLSLKSANPEAPSARAPKNVTSQFVGIDSTSAKRFPTGQHPCQGLFWTLQGKKPSVVFMLSHYIADYMEHYIAVPLAQRGYGVLGWNTRFRGAEDSFVLEKAIDDLAVGTRWLRETTGAQKIVFIGNSGGGSLMAALQAKAENDPSIFGANAFIFLNAHPGRADVLANWIDPSVTDETDPVATDPNLDMYSIKNKPPYPKDFITRYRAAQKERSERITQWVKEELKRVNAAGIPDRVFNVHRTMADLRFLDPTIEPSDRPHPACYAGEPELANRNIGMLGRSSTLQTWLSMWSLEDSKSRFEHTGPRFTIPTIVIQGKADVGVYPSDAQKIFDLVGSKDKEIHLVTGAHFFEDSEQSLTRVVDLIEEWVGKRLL